MGVLGEEIVHEPGLPFRYYVGFARSRVRDRVVDHQVEDGVRSSASFNVAYEFPCPKCGAVPRLNPHRLADQWLAAARAGNRSLYVT
jgi:hypothetical protein